MDIYKILAYIIIITVGTIVYKLVTKDINLNWSKIIGIWIVGFILIFLGASNNSIIIVYLGIILAGLGTVIGFGKMFSS